MPDVKMLNTLELGSICPILYISSLDCVEIREICDAITESPSVLRRFHGIQGCGYFLFVKQKDGRIF